MALESWPRPTDEQVEQQRRPAFFFRNCNNLPCFWQERLCFIMCTAFLRFTRPWCNGSFSFSQVTHIWWCLSFGCRQFNLACFGSLGCHGPTPRITLVHFLPSARPSPSSPPGWCSFFLCGGLTPSSITYSFSSPSLVAPYQTLHLWVFYCVVSLLRRTFGPAPDIPPPTKKLKI